MTNEYAPSMRRSVWTSELATPPISGCAAFELVPERGGVGQVAVVGDGNLAARAIHRERLGVAEIGRAGG